MSDKFKVAQELIVHRFEQSFVLPSKHILEMIRCLKLDGEAAKVADQNGWLYSLRNNI
jgi:hypothetical protein